MLNWIVCLIWGHRWGKWFKYNTGELWGDRARWCLRCGKWQGALQSGAWDESQDPKQQV